MQPRFVHVKTHPASSKEVLVSLGPGTLEAWVKAKPTEGLANNAVLTLLARHLNLASSQIKLVKGRSSRHKIFRLLL